jgi:hypothetical protein
VSGVWNFAPVCIPKIDCVTIKVRPGLAPPLWKPWRVDKLYRSICSWNYFDRNNVLWWTWGKRNSAHLLALVLQSSSIIVKFKFCGLGNDCPSSFDKSDLLRAIWIFMNRSWHHLCFPKTIQGLLLIWSWNISVNLMSFFKAAFVAIDPSLFLLSIFLSNSSCQIGKILYFGNSISHLTFRWHLKLEEACISNNCRYIRRQQNCRILCVSQDIKLRPLVRKLLPLEMIMSHDSWVTSHDHRPSLSSNQMRQYLLLFHA